MRSKFKLAFDKELTGELSCVEVDIPMYKCSLKILNTSNTKKLHKKWRKEDSKFAMSIRDYLESNGYLLIETLNFSTDSLVHELHHAVDMIMEYIGHKKNRPCEPSAYLIGYLFKEVMKHEKYLMK